MSDLRFGNGKKPIRDGAGRFERGTAPGPGAPRGGRAALLRAALLEAVPPERLKRIIDALATKAEAGEWRPAQLLLSYVLGRPSDELERDQQDYVELTRQRFDG